MPINIPPFESDEQMLAWCKETGVTPSKDNEGRWDWQELYRQREEELEKLYGPRVFMKVNEAETREEFKKRVIEQFRKKGFFNKGNKPSDQES